MCSMNSKKGGQIILGILMERSESRRYLARRAKIRQGIFQREKVKSLDDSNKGYHRPSSKIIIDKPKPISRYNYDAEKEFIEEETKPEQVILDSDGTSRLLPGQLNINNYKKVILSLETIDQVIEYAKSRPRDPHLIIKGHIEAEIMSPDMETFDDLILLILRDAKRKQWRQRKK